MNLFSNSAHKTQRDKTQQMISGYLLLNVMWALKHAGVFEAMAKSPVGMEPAEYALAANMSEDVLTALLNYTVHEGLATWHGQRVSLTALGHTVVADADGLIEQVGAYEPVIHLLEHLLAKLKTYGNGLSRKNDSHAIAVAARYGQEIFPAIQAAIARQRCQCILDVFCGTGDALIYTAEKVNPLVGVATAPDGVLTRRANNHIAEKQLEKRLIAVTANLAELAATPRETFDRLGVSPQVWQKFDGVLACGALGEVASVDMDKAATALNGLVRTFSGALFFVAEPCSGRQFAKSPGAAELELLLRLSRGRLLPVEDWNTILVRSGLEILEQSSLATDGIVLFTCAPAARQGR